MNYERLANVFDFNASKDSSYKRILRYMTDFDFPMRVVSSLIFSILHGNANLTLVFDKINLKFETKNLNILILGSAIQM